MDYNVVVWDFYAFILVFLAKLGILGGFGYFPLIFTRKIFLELRPVMLLEEYVDTENAARFPPFLARIGPRNGFNKVLPIFCSFPINYTKFRM